MVGKSRSTPVLFEYFGRCCFRRNMKSQQLTLLFCFLNEKNQYTTIWILMWKVQVVNKRYFKKIAVVFFVIWQGGKMKLGTPREGDVGQIELLSLIQSHVYVKAGPAKSTTTTTKWMPGEGNRIPPIRQAAVSEWCSSETTGNASLV